MRSWSWALREVHSFRHPILPLHSGEEEGTQEYLRHRSGVYSLSVSRLLLSVNLLEHSLMRFSCDQAEEKCER